ncbi:bifunctional DNA primase/polymerase [Streptomyces sp. NRRL F-5630]|uniref:bifunctional DNA primase/polymerase n=1 Tax=Streptomyces sp. NRRL F-5630 TaxID=1463864 RepID=UPI003D731B86
MANRTCEHCDGPMPIMARAHAVTCSPRCRKARSRARRTVPVELAQRPRWVRRTSSKVPVTVDGAVASSTDPETWSTYRTATDSTAGAGLGFVLDGDGVVCLDLDHALDDQGAPLPWAQRILDTAGPTWVERSVSGDGLHVWGTGSLPRGRRITVDDGGSIELYGDGRYIAVTGNAYDGAPLRLGNLQPVLAELGCQ